MGRNRQIWKIEKEDSRGLEVEGWERKPRKMIWATGINGTAMRTSRGGVSGGRKVVSVCHLPQDIGSGRQLTTQIWLRRSSPPGNSELEDDELRFKTKVMKNRKGDLGKPEALNPITSTKRVEEPPEDTREEGTGERRKIKRQLTVAGQGDHLQIPSESCGKSSTSGPWVPTPLGMRINWRHF